MERWDGVYGAGLERVSGRGGVCEVAQRDFLGGWFFAPVVVARFEGQAAAVVPFGHGERAGAYWLGCEVVYAVGCELRANKRCHVPQPCLGWVFERDFERGVVDGFDFFDDVHAGFEAVLPRVAFDSFDRELSGFRVELGAVGEGHTLAQREGVFGAVLRDVPGFCEQRLEVAVLVDRHEPFIHVGHERLRDGGARCGGEVEVGWCGGQPDGDRGFVGAVALAVGSFVLLAGAASAACGERERCGGEHGGDSCEHADASLAAVRAGFAGACMSSFEQCGASDGYGLSV